jgi:hypothetical protein
VVGGNYAKFWKYKSAMGARVLWVLGVRGGLTGFGLSALGGAVCDLFETAEGFVDGIGVGEGFQEVGGDHDDVGSLLEQVRVLAADSLAEVEGGALGKWVWFRRLLPIGESRLRWQDGHR